MLGLVARLIGGAVTPLIDQAAAFGARLLVKLALFIVSGLSVVVVMIALTVAFDLWIASMKGPIVGALAVAGLYAIIAAIALFFAMRTKDAKKTARAQDAEKEAAADRRAATGIDEFAAPLLRMLERAGLKKEQLAVLAGMSVAKQVGPIPMVGLAIVAGFLVGRMWRGLSANDLFAGLVTSELFTGLFGGKKQSNGSAEPDDSQDRAAA